MVKSESGRESLTALGIYYRHNNTSQALVSPLFVTIFFFTVYLENE